MATSKTLTPTNVTIQIPAFADKPDQRVNSNCIDKEADAINALSDQMANMTSVEIASVTTTGGYGLATKNGYIPIFAFFDENWHVKIDKANSSQGTYTFGFTLLSNADGSLIQNGTYPITVVYIKGTL